MKRLPRKIKKQLKKKFLNRYGINWNMLNYDRNRLIVEYNWFFKNPFNWDMDKKLN